MFGITNSEPRTGMFVPSLYLRIPSEARGWLCSRLCTIVAHKELHSYLCIKHRYLHHGSDIVLKEAVLWLLFVWLYSTHVTNAYGACFCMGL